MSELIRQRESIFNEVELLKSNVIKYISLNGEDATSNAMYKKISSLMAKYNKLDAMIRR